MNRSNKPTLSILKVFGVRMIRYLLILALLAYPARAALVPGPFSTGAVGHGDVTADSAEIYYWGDYLLNREHPAFDSFWTGAGTPYPEVTVQMVMAGGNAVLSIYEDPQNNVSGTDESTYTDGELLARFTGTGTINLSYEPFRHGSINIQWADSWPLVNVGTEYEIWPNAIDCSVNFTYRIPGDCDGDGWITGVDYAQIDAAYLTHMANARWVNGDFNGDGVVTVSDFNMMDPPYMANVPEPGAAGLLLGGLAILRKMRV